MIIYKLAINTTLNSSKAETAPPRAARDCSELKDVLVFLHLHVHTKRSLCEEDGRINKTTAKTTERHKSVHPAFFRSGFDVEMEVLYIVK